MALLEVERASKRYGDLKVVDELTFHVESGEVLGVIGPNGAGKTTVLSMIAGEVPFSGGSARFEGEDITRLPTHRRAPLGIGRTFQVPRPFTGMTVFENTMVGALHGRRDRADAAARAVDALAQVRLLDRVNSKAGALTLLELKRLELARALVTDPKVILLDESAGGLTEAEVEELLPTVAQLKHGGTAVVWIEHVIHALLALADRVICIDRGRKLVEGSPQAVMASSAVQDVYLGTMVS